MKQAPNGTRCVNCGVDIYILHDTTIPLDETTCQPCELDMDNPDMWDVE